MVSDPLPTCYGVALQRAMHKYLIFVCIFLRTSLKSEIPRWHAHHMATGPQNQHTHGAGDSMRRTNRPDLQSGAGESRGSPVRVVVRTLLQFCVAVITAAIPHQLIPASMAHATANKKVTKVKATSHPTYKTQPLAKGHMPIRRVPCAEEAFPLRRGPKGQAAGPRTGPPAPTEQQDAFQTASCGRWPRCGRAQSLSRLYTVGGWEVGWGHRPCVIATANRHQAPK